MQALQETRGMSHFRITHLMVHSESISLCGGPAEQKKSRVVNYRKGSWRGGGDFDWRGGGVLAGKPDGTGPDAHGG